MNQNNSSETRAKGIYWWDIMELKSIGLKEAWMRVTSGNKVDSLGDCIMVLPFIEREDAVEFSLRRKTVRFV